jgi:hypothetical protein
MLCWRAGPEQGVKPVHTRLDARQGLKHTAFVLKAQVFLLHQTFDLGNCAGRTGGVNGAEDEPHFGQRKQRHIASVAFDGLFRSA